MLQPLFHIDRLVWKTSGDEAARADSRERRAGQSLWTRSRNQMTRRTAISSHKNATSLWRANIWLSQCRRVVHEDDDTNANAQQRNEEKRTTSKKIDPFHFAIVMIQEE